MMMSTYSDQFKCPDIVTIYGGFSIIYVVEL